MTVLVHTPYGSYHKESALIYLLANYLHTINLPIKQVLCNGVFSLCDRDEETGWKRQIDSCMNCTVNQRSLASWGNIEAIDLSKYLSPDEVTLTRRMLNELSVEQLAKVKYAGISLFDLSLESFKARAGGIAPDLSNKRHEQLLRRYLLSAARMCLTVKRMLATLRPDYTLLSSGEDFITRSYLEQAQKNKSCVLLFKMDIHQRCIKIINSLDGKSMNCPFMLSDVRTMRADVNTWPSELNKLMLDISSFMGVSESQIALPLAQ